MNERKPDLPGNILVVDDDAYTRMWARRCLEQAHHTVREATDAEQALGLIAETPPDLILLDVLLPDANGIELTRRLRQDGRLNSVAIILMTSLDDLESKVRGLEAGANDFLVKLPESEELQARVRTFLRLRRNQKKLLDEQNKTNLLYQVSRELSAELDLDTMLGRILQLTMETIGASRGNIILLDEGGTILRHIFSHQDELSTTKEDALGKIVRNGLAGWVIQEHRGTILPDAHEDERWIIVEDFHRQMRSVITVPLVHQEQVAGILTLTHETVNRFTAEHLELLNSIASQATVALLNARLFEQVTQERAQLKAIVTGTADAIVATDRKLRLTLLNPAAERAFDVSSTSAEGWRIEEILPYEALVGAFRRAALQPPPHPPTELTLPDGRTLFFSVSEIGAGSRAGGGWVAVMQDISHLKELERMKNDFVSAVSHDLRTPLANIHGYAELLQKMVAEKEGQELAEHIKGNALRTAGLVEELLDLGKIEAGMESAQEDCNLTEIVAEAVAMAEPQAQQSQIALQADVAALSAPVRGSPVRLRQVLDNLLNNAFKYTPTEGSIQVRLGEKDGRASVTVQDTGMGIPRDALPRIFEKFYRVPGASSQQTVGSGLGLAIVKAIVEQHGGEIWVESEVGQGSTFGFSLPLEDPPQGSSKAPVEAST
ncbi:MAG: response regulator [Chloroflexia bacterium]|nr:response regulator [Chloroflexia bacterium]